MFEKFAQAAERAATSVSRREFLGRLGNAAMGAAGAVGAIAFLPGTARASYPCWFCLYTCPGGGTKALNGRKLKCWPTYEGCNLTSERKGECRI
jgi:hypothetical protein